MYLNFLLLDGLFSIHQLAPESTIPPELIQCGFFSITRTDDELSIVCPSSLTFSSKKSVTGWNCLKIIGPLDFSLTGILAEISSSLAEQKISIFALSTYDTDYILVKSTDLRAALDTLEKEGHTIK